MLSVSFPPGSPRGLNVVGHTAVSSTLAILVPFIVLSLLCIPRARPSNWLVMDLDSVDWATFLNIMFWNLNYWDNVSTLAGEVRGRQIRRSGGRSDDG